ncbi:MAG: PAS domain S-box protein [Proteobacteria bacterium]|nr:PAS domain S-box protein [Pseudomonadota bacterium]
MSKDGNPIGREQWLSQQLEEKEAIIDGISDILMVLGVRTYKILDVNEAFIKSYGLSRQEVLGKSCYEVTHHMSIPCHRADSHCPCPMENSTLTGHSSYVEHVHRDHEGKTLYFEIAAHPLKDGGGQVTRVIHLSRDITWRKRLENEVIRSEEKYRTIFNSMPNPVFVLDVRDLQIIDCNDNVLAVYGFSKEELVRNSFLDFWEEGERERYASELKTSNIMNQVRQIDKKGQTIFVNIHVSPSEYLGRKVLLVTASDITKRLMAEQQLIQASKMATLGEMATGIAHELNQPLSVIKTASSFLGKKVRKGEAIEDEIMKTMAGEINVQVDRATKVINHLREFGRKSDIRKEKVQVNKPLNKSLEIFSYQLRLREIEVVKDLEEDLPPIMADSNRLEQVFVNLLINARDAIEERWSRSDRKGEKKIFLKTSSKDGTVVIEIKDTGMGIPKSIVDKIFEPFFTTKKMVEGTGLGLSISYSIVQDYGGTITVETRYGEGSNFIIQFPISSNG